MARGIKAQIGEVLDEVDKFAMPYDERDLQPGEAYELNAIRRNALARIAEIVSHVHFTLRK